MNVTFHHLPVSRNKLQGKNWRVAHGERTRWRKIVGTILGHKEPRETEFQRVEITMYRWALQDLDNAYGSVKHVLDALTHYGWIADDRRTKIDLKVGEFIERQKPKQRTEVIITPATK